MYLPTAGQNDTAALIAKRVRENTTGYDATAAEVSRPSYCATAVVTITKYSGTACVAMSEDTPEDAGRVVESLLSHEKN